MKTTKLANVIGGVGLLGGMFYGIKNQKAIGIVALYGLAFGVVGYYIGNSVSKFYEN